MEKDEEMGITCKDIVHNTDCEHKLHNLMK